MTAYVIADIKVTDDKWVPAYAASVHDLVHKHGGKYLSRSGNVKTLEGKPLGDHPHCPDGVSIGGRRPRHSSPTPDMLLSPPPVRAAAKAVSR